MPSLLDKLRGKSKRKSKSGTGFGHGEGYSSGAGSDSDAGGRSSASFDMVRPDVSGRGAGGAESVKDSGRGYESLPNGSSVVVNSSGVPPPLPPKDDVLPSRDSASSSTRHLARKASPVEADAIPPRSTSLNPAAAQPVNADENGVTEGIGKMAIREQYAGDGQQFHRRSMDGKSKSPRLGSDANEPLPAHESQHRDTVEALHRGFLDGDNAKDVMQLGDDFVEPETVIAARTEMAEKIAADARQAYKRINSEQREIFERAGLTENLDNRGEVEVRTEWLKPVVHETIRPVVHTETTEVVTIDRHIYHIYPKIQPIHDPDPIRLPPRHRIFNPSTNAWHEVVGDEAAIAILGPAVFYNGWREYREYRAPALPGLTEDGEVLVFSEMRGSKQPAFEARQIEREGERGNLGSWKALVGKLDGKGNGGDDAKMIGEVDRNVGARTMNIKF